MSEPREPRVRPVVRSGGELRAGTRVGDRHFRVAPRAQPQEVLLPALRVRRIPPNPAIIFVYGFGALILLGALTLMLPVSRASGEWTPFLDALFTSTSAVCVTGLVVVDTATYWSGFGQAVILALFQLGGLGFMTSSTLLLLLLRRQATLRERVLLRESLGSGGLGTALGLARKILLFTLLAEVAGVIILTLRFLVDHEPDRALWWGVFHSVSAFNNAGFDLVGDFASLSPYRDDPFVLLPIAILFLFGGISYTVVEDVIKQRRFSRLTLDSKLVLITFAALSVSGTAALLFTEWRNTQTLGAMELGTRLLNAFFATITRTAGFSTFDVGAMSEDGLFVMMALMFIGGSAGSTAGGIKVQTFSLLFFAIISAVRGVADVEAFQRRVPVPVVLRSIAVVLIALALLFTMTFVLNVIEDAGFIPVLFETVSALATVGLSTGITPELSPLGRVIIIGCMFVGRLGPLTLVLALAARERPTRYRWPNEGIKIG